VAREGQIGHLWNNWLMAVAASCGHAVAMSPAVCCVRLGWLRSEEAKTKPSTSGRSEREAGFPRARMHRCIRTRSRDRGAAYWLKLDKPQAACELPWTMML